jgi:ABC-2 type transport system ATP-binding protein
MLAIVAEQLIKHFSADIKAVDGIDLNVPEGQIFGFLGPNGSGKTTTVRMLTTLLRPTDGEASVAGFDITRQPGEVRKAIGVALQEAGLDDLATGRELLVLQGHLHAMRTGEAAERASQLLSVVDLTDAADRQIRGYSGGMKRRLDLAAALMHRPSVVFLDEPTTGLDPISRAAIWRYVRELNTGDGVTFFLTTQYMEEADQLAQDVAIMSAGHIVTRGSPADLKAQIGADVITVHIEGDEHQLDRATAAVRPLDGLEDARSVDGSLIIYVRDGQRAIARVVMLLGEASVPIGEISLAHPTLDDVFLRITGHHIEADDPYQATETLERSGE